MYVLINRNPPARDTRRSGYDVFRPTAADVARRVYELVVVNTELGWLEVRLATLRDHVDYFRRGGVGRGIARTSLTGLRYTPSPRCRYVVVQPRWLHMGASFEGLVTYCRYHKRDVAPKRRTVRWLLRLLNIPFWLAVCVRKRRCLLGTY